MLKYQGLTAERPHRLEADSLARYNHALKYCVGKKVLDIGTGFGFGAEYIIKNGARQVLGIDYSQKAIRRAKEIKGYDNLSFKKINALDLDCIEESYDVILAFEIIEHIPIERVKEFIILLYCHLKTNGILLLSTPNSQKSVYFMGRLYNPYHTKEYGKSEIKNLLSEYFTELDIEGYGVKNNFYQKTNNEITKSVIYKISYILGHFRIIREMLAFIPESIKHIITKENKLPLLTNNDFIFTEDSKNYNGLFIAAKKGIAESVNNPFVSVVIANYNGAKFLYGCLDSLLLSKYNNFEIVICDDASTDNSWEILNIYKTKDSRIKLIRNISNIGAAASRNNAINMTRGDLVIFLDSDTRVDKKCLYEIVSVFENNPSIGAAQAVLLDMNKKNLVQHAGGLLIPQTIWLIPFMQWRRYQSVKKEIFERNIVAVSAALAVRKKVLKIIVGFDSEESVHTEDLDFCWRIWISGYKVVLANKAIVYHLTKSKSDRSHMGSNYFTIYFHLAKNSFRSMIKNYEIGNLLRYLPISIFINLTRGLLVITKRRDMSAFLATLKAIFWNFINLSDSIKLRKKIQSTRSFSDKFIMKEVFDKRNLIEIYNQNFKQTKLLW